MNSYETDNLKELFYSGQYDLVYTIVEGLDIDYIELDPLMICKNKTFEDTVPIKNTNLFLDFYKYADTINVGLSLHNSRVQQWHRSLELMKCKDFIISESKKSNTYYPDVCYMTGLTDIEISKLLFNVKI